MEKVKINVKMVEMSELPGYKVMAPKGKEEIWLENFRKMAEWDEIGIAKRYNTVGEELTPKILHWLWADGVSSVIQRLTAADVSTVQFIIGTQCFHKFNVGLGWWDWRATSGTLANDPHIIECKKKGIPSDQKEIFEPDIFMQWSGDTHYPFNFAYFSDADQVCQAFSEHAERGNVYGLEVQNFFFFTRENYPRIGYLVGVTGLNIPGRMVKEKHRYVQEKPKMVPDKFTHNERELIAKTEQISAVDKLGIRERLDQLLADLKAGKLEDKLLKPGVRTWHANEIPWESGLRRDLKWWDNHKMDENGVLENYGEFEAEEYEKLLKELGYSHARAEN
jgi:hypothetical protein